MTTKHDPTTGKPAKPSKAVLVADQLDLLERLYKSAAIEDQTPDRAAELDNLMSRLHDMLLEAAPVG